MRSYLFKKEKEVLIQHSTSVDEGNHASLPPAVSSRKRSRTILPVGFLNMSNGGKKEDICVRRTRKTDNTNLKIIDSKINQDLDREEEVTVFQQNEVEEKEVSIIEQENGRGEEDVRMKQSKVSGEENVNSNQKKVRGKEDTVIYQNEVEEEEVSIIDQKKVRGKEIAKIKQKKLEGNKVEKIVSPGINLYYVLWWGNPSNITAERLVR